MSLFVWGFLAGALVGANVGLLVAGLCAAAKSGDRLPDCPEIPAPPVSAWTCSHCGAVRCSSGDRCCSRCGKPLPVTVQP